MWYYRETVPSKCIPWVCRQARLKLPNSKMRMWSKDHSGYQEPGIPCPPSIRLHSGLYEPLLKSHPLKSEHTMQASGLAKEMPTVCQAWKWDGVYGLETNVLQSFVNYMMMCRVLVPTHSCGLEEKTELQARELTFFSLTLDINVGEAPGLRSYSSL